MIYLEGPHFMTSKNKANFEVKLAKMNSVLENESDLEY
jgi:hypothetical protein